MRNNVRGKNKSFIPRVDKGRCCPLGGFDYKAVGFLKRYISDSGKIDSGKRSGNCAKCQRNLTLAIKRARHMALIPYASNHLYDTSLISEPEAKEEVSGVVRGLKDLLTVRTDDGHMLDDFLETNFQTLKLSEPVKNEIRKLKEETTSE